MSKAVGAIERFARLAEQVLPHRFDIIEQLDDGTRIPSEALSEDHTIGLYYEQIPLKMLDEEEAFIEVGWDDFERQTGPDGDYLEYAPLRHVRFRAEKMQYLTEGWWVTTPCVRYPAATAEALARLMEESYGEAHLYLHPKMPMPLWIRTESKGQDYEGVQAVIQARGPDRMLPVNIHTEVTMEYARRWEELARSYYLLADS
ncbi:MAG: hypothetical protein IT210_26455 [Armatimonadetes bacterium]|nr:hypothetical protein [Armatimonadota bacterium]